MSDAPETPNTPPADAPSVVPAPAPTPEVPPVDMVLRPLVKALDNFIGSLSAKRAEDLAAATVRAGGDHYKAESHGFDPKAYDIIGKAEDFLRALSRG